MFIIKMNKELLRMSFLAGIITEGEYKQELAGIQLNDINEGKQVGDIYHYTRLILLYPILKSGVLKPSQARSEKLGYISFSRDKALGMTLGSSKSQVRITVDGDKLSTKYKISPYSQLEPETKYDKENWVAPFSRSTQDSESELVVPSEKYGGKIDITPYIKQIDILIYPYRAYSISGNEQKKEIEKINKINKTLNIPIKYHDDPEEKNYSYWSPQKNKTVN
jgi:hypothetical protein